MNLAEQLDNTLRLLRGFSSAREQLGQVWVAEDAADGTRARSVRSVAVDLRNRLQEVGFVVDAANETSYGRVVPCVYVRGVDGESLDGEIERILVVSHPMLARFRDVHSKIKQLDRADTSYQNIQAYAELVQQGIFLSRRKIKDNHKRIERIRSYQARTDALTGSAPTPTTVKTPTRPAVDYDNSKTVPLRPTASAEAGVALRTLMSPSALFGTEPVIERDNVRFGTFLAMVSAWEVHVAGGDDSELRHATALVAAEVRRIEGKYGRHREGSVVSKLNNSAGSLVRVDVETAWLLDFAQTLWFQSAGRFDITAGPLRRIRPHQSEQISDLMSVVGWDKVYWSGESLRLPPGMQIDLGFIVKHYAVDRALAHVASEIDHPAMVNGGGCLAASAPRRPDDAWRVGVDTPTNADVPRVPLKHGGIATVGSLRRQLSTDTDSGGLLDPRTGSPVDEVPRSVTVHAESCLKAGSHSTVALMHGAGAEGYLLTQPHLQFWVQR